MHHYIISMFLPLTSLLLIAFIKCQRKTASLGVEKIIPGEIIFCSCSDRALCLQKKASVTKVSFYDLLTKYYLLSNYCILLTVFLTAGEILCSSVLRK